MASGAKIRTACFAALSFLQDLVEFRTIENRAMFFWVFTRAVHMAVIALTCDASFWAECFPVRVNRAANLSAFRCKNKLSLFLKKSIFFNFSQIFSNFLKFSLNIPNSNSNILKFFKKLLSSHFPFILVSFRKNLRTFDFELRLFRKKSMKIGKKFGKKSAFFAKPSNYETKRISSFRVELDLGPSLENNHVLFWRYLCNWDSKCHGLDPEGLDRCNSKWDKSVVCKSRHHAVRT